MYIIKNKFYADMYVADNPGEYTTKDKAKIFKNKEITLMVASLLTVAEQGHFEIIPIGEKS